MIIGSSATLTDHFNHANIIKYCARPFRDAREMNEVMIANWNELVKPGDVVWHHGDFGFFRKPEEGDHILARLNGAITLLKGNHDSSQMIKRMKFQDIIMMKEWKVPPAKIKMITMCHYPMDGWRGSHRGEWHTHGHTHGTFGRDGRLRIDVGVDAKVCKKIPKPASESYEDRRLAQQTTFRPLHLNEIVKEFRRQEQTWKSNIKKHGRD